MFEEVRIVGDFTLSSGAKSNVYYAVEALTPREVSMYASLLAVKIPLEPLDFIVTPAYGGIPLATLIAFHMRLPLITVEKDNKLRGPNLDGVGDRYLIVDDVVSTYNEIERVTRLVRRHKSCNPIGVACYMFRGTIERPHPPLYYLEKKEAEK